MPLPNIYFSHTTDLIRQLSHTHMLLPFLNLGTNTTSYYLISRSRVAQCEELWSLNHEVASSNPSCNDFFFLNALINPADIWRQYDVGMTFNSDVGLTLESGWKWKFSRRRILVGLVATKNQPDSNVFTTSDWSRPKINLLPTSLQRRVPAGLSFIKVREFQWTRSVWNVELSPTC